MYAGGRPSWSDSEEEDEAAQVPVPLFKLLRQSPPNAASQTSTCTGLGQCTTSESVSSTATKVKHRLGGRSDEAASGSNNKADKEQAQAVSSSKDGASRKEGVTEAGGMQAQAGQSGGVSCTRSGTVQGHHRSKDPLRWFGVLVPPPLRSAQAQFNQGGWLGGMPGHIRPA